MVERNWKTLSMFLESIDYTPIIDSRRGFLHFYNHKKDKEITFEKQNKYSKLEVEIILDTNDIGYNSFRVFSSSLNNRITS